MTRGTTESEVASETAVAPPSFERVAQLVAGQDPPNWLIEQFRTQSALLAHILCAMMTAEAWKFVRGKYPGARNSQAAEAAEMHWKLCVLPDGGRLPRTERVSFGNPLNAWRPHFKAAMDTRLGFETHRSELLRYLKLASHFGKNADLEPIPEEKGAN
jgi:hypothetical protein